MGGNGDGGSVVRREVLRFAIPGFTSLVVLALMSIWVANQVATAEALRAATAQAELMARSAIEPALAGSPWRDPQAVDAVVRDQLLVEPVVAIRLWNRSGRVVYATEPRLIGQRFGLGEEEQEVLANGGAEAEVSDLGKPENQYERQHGELVEVYLPVEDGFGGRYLLEVYTRQSAIEEAARRISIAYAPVIGGSLLVLTAILVGLGWRMAQRIQRESRERELLLHRALDASEDERRRIAADLHDGVVQDLVGVSYTLAAMSDTAARDGRPEHADVLDATAGRARGAVRALRSLLVDIYPKSLSDAGLTAAVADLVAGLPSGIDAALDADEPVDVADEQQAALYRAAREALQNVARHSGAQRVTVSLEPTAAGARLTVADDGVGFDPAARPSGHLGLQLLADLAASQGGTCTITSTPDQGTEVVFEVPRS